MTEQTPLAEILVNLSSEDRANHLRAVENVGTIFSDRTTVQVNPQLISELPSVRVHVLSGGAVPLDVDAAIAELKNVPDINAALVKAEVKAAEISTIQSDTATMTPQQRMNYAREHGLDRPRADATASMTQSEHLAVISGLSPQNRMAYARRHGLV